MFLYGPHVTIVKFDKWCVKQNVLTLVDEVDDIYSLVWLLCASRICERLWLLAWAERKWTREDETLSRRSSWEELQDMNDDDGIQKHRKRLFLKRTLNQPCHGVSWSEPLHLSSFVTWLLSFVSLSTRWRHTPKCVSCGRCLLKQLSLQLSGFLSDMNKPLILNTCDTHINLCILIV